MHNWEFFRIPRNSEEFPENWEFSSQGKCHETEQEPSVKEIELQEDVIRNMKCRALSLSNVNTVVKKKIEVSEEASDPVPGPGIFYTIPVHQSCFTHCITVQKCCSN